VLAIDSRLLAGGIGSKAVGESGAKIIRRDHGIDDEI
jgi:hypothetical protein